MRWGLKWWVSGGILLLVLVIVGVLGYWWSGRSSRNLVATQVKEDYQPKFSFLSRITGIKVTETKEAQDFITRRLRDFGYPKPLVFNYWQNGEAARVQPEEIAFAFLPINDLSEENKGNLLYKQTSGGEIRGGIRHEMIGDKLEFQIFLDLDLQKAKDEKQWASSLTYFLIRALYIGNPDGKQDPESVSKIWSEVRENGLWPVEMKKEISLYIPKVFDILLDLWVPAVLAQSCGNYVECGEYREDFVCPDGSACIVEGDLCPLPYGGTCQPKDWGCYMHSCANCGADKSVNCYALGSQAACNAATCSKPPPYCTYSPCTWGGPFAPTPIPGGSGVCGSCTDNCDCGDCTCDLGDTSRWDCIKCDESCTTPPCAKKCVLVPCTSCTPDCTPPTATLTSFTYNTVNISISGPAGYDYATLGYEVTSSCAYGTPNVYPLVIYTTTFTQTGLNSGQYCHYEIGRASGCGTYCPDVLADQ